MYKTTDYGKTWTKCVNGIPENHFTRVVREDPNCRPLFAGTEFGIYVSYDSVITGSRFNSCRLFHDAFGVPQAPTTSWWAANPRPRVMMDPPFERDSRPDSH